MNEKVPQPRADRAMGTTSAATPRHGGVGATVALLGGLFITNIDVAVANIAIPSIGASLGASGAELQLVVAAYIFSYAMLLITAARVGGLYGFRRVYLVGLMLFALASLACGVAPDATVLVLSRLVQGVGASLIVPQVLASIKSSLSGAPQARALGLYPVALSAGAVTGQVLGGLVIAANLFDLSWRPIFLINVPIVALLVLLALRYLPRDRGEGAARSASPRGRSGSLDLRGAGILSCAIAALIVPLMAGRAEGWPAWSWLLLGASPAAGALFVAAERGLAAAGGRPLLDLNVLDRRPVAWGLVTHMAVSLAYFAMLFTLSIYLQRGLGESPASAGLVLLPWVAAFGVAGPILARLPAHGKRIAGLAGYSLVPLSFLGMSLCLVTGREVGLPFLGSLAAGGLGMGAGFGSLIARLTAAVPDHRAPDLSGLLATAMQVAASVGVAAVGGLYLSLLSGRGPHSPTDALAVVMAALGGVATLGAFAAARCFGGEAPECER